ncbi:MAG: VWA domain-containing protein, partial [Bacteroidota bacterium]
MTIQNKLQQEYERFVEFGELLDRRSRQYLVAFFQHKITGAPIVAPELNDQYAQYFHRALDNILAIENLLPLLQNNQRIAEHVVLDTLYWMRKTFSQVRTQHPYQKEEELLKGWAVTPLKAFRDRHPYLLNFLRGAYAKEELNTDFYQDRFQSFLNGALDEKTAEERQRFELIFTDLLSQWDALLQAKILAYQLQKFTEEEESYTQLLEAKVSGYKKMEDLLNPVTQYLGWDLSKDLWKDTSFDILEQYEELLQDEASIRELVDLLGEMKEAEIVIEEETYEKTIIRKEWQVDELAKTEIVGVHESQDLSNLVSSEVGLLSDQNTEALFLKKFVDQQLLTFRYEDQRLVTSKDNQMEVHQRVRKKEKGPFIVLVDTSESMHGRPEQIAKCLCLGILKMAIQDNRRAYLINFSIGIQTIDLYDIYNSLEEVAKFLRMSFNGGTDASLALTEAVRQLRTNDYEDADVLMISDFIMYRLDKDVLDEVSYFQQNKGTEFHSLTLSREANSDILQRFDTNWLYDPTQKGIIRELTR